MSADSKKVYLIPSYVVAPNRFAEFNEQWGKEVLPYVVNHSNYIGSFVNIAGGPLNETIRLLEFDDFSQWEKWDYDIHHTPEGQKVLDVLARFNPVMERRFLRRIY